MKNQKSYGHILLVALFSLSILFATYSPAMAADPTGKIITSVTIKGNATVKENLITDVIKVKVGDTVTADAVKADMQSIYDVGYFFDVVSNFNEVPEGVELIYTVMENPVLQDIVIKGNTKMTTDKILSMLAVKKGTILNAKTLNENTKAIEKEYHDQGYILSKVSDVSMSPAGVLTLTINEGMLEAIEVKGNDKTRDYVITREMKLKPNQPFNVKDAKRSMQKVYNLGFFEDVNMKLNPGKEPNAIVLETSVVEQRTGKFTIGGGYSDSDGLVGIIGLGDDNFRGTGDKVNIQWEFGGNASNATNKTNYQFSYTRPWLDSKQTSLGVSVYDMTTESYDYNDSTGAVDSTYYKQRKGWSATLGRPDGEYVQNYLTFKQINEQYIKYVSGTDNSANDTYLKDNFGLTNSIALNRVYDSRDNVFSPTEGTRLSLTSEFSGGALGGDFSYGKYSAETRNYFKVGPSQVFAVRASAGYANGTMPDNARFAEGGSDSLRGYRDSEFKGNKMLNATAEYRFPIAKKVEGVVFGDIGNAWTTGEGYSLSNLKSDAGIGVRVGTPIGPIRIDLAKGSQGTRTQFSFGGQF